MKSSPCGVCTIDKNVYAEIQVMKIALPWKLVAEMQLTGKLKMPTLPKLLIGAMSQFRSNPENEEFSSKSVLKK